MPTDNVKWSITTKKTLAPNTFGNFLKTIFKLFPESQAKLLANNFYGEVGRCYSRKDHGFTCKSLDTAQCIWTSTLAENCDVTIDSYQNPSTRQEIYLIRERKVERTFSDNSSMNRFFISEVTLKCPNLTWNIWTKHSQLYAVNTDGIFMTHPCR